LKRNTVASISLIACFMAVSLLSTLAISSESIALPIVMDDQGFQLTITYYYVSGSNTIILIGSVESPLSVTLASLTGLAFINGVTVGSGRVDQQYLQLTGGVPESVSATVTTNFNIYTALWFGEIAVDGGTRIPFNYDSTSINVVLSAQICTTAQGGHCFSWPGFSHTSTLALL